MKREGLSQADVDLAGKKGTRLSSSDRRARNDFDQPTTKAACWL